MKLLSYKLYNESIYSAAAMLAGGNFTKPVYNKQYSVKKVFIKFPDLTELPFHISREDYFSDKVNYQIKSDDPRSIQSLYIKVFGDLIQMENYQEYVFVRCWNNQGDFNENKWNGFIFNNNDIGFNEISLEFETSPRESMASPKFSDLYFHNPNIYKQQLIAMISIYLRDFPNRPSYDKMIKLKRKFESFLIRRDETNPVNLINESIDSIKIISIIYLLSIYDNTILKSLDINSISLEYCPVKNLLDIYYK